MKYKSNCYRTSKLQRGFSKNWAKSKNFSGHVDTHISYVLKEAQCTQCVQPVWLEYDLLWRAPQIPLYEK